MRRRPEALDALRTVAFVESSESSNRIEGIAVPRARVERLVEDARAGHYESLEASSIGWHEQHHDPLPWCRYLWGVLLRGYREFEQRIDALADVRQSKGLAVPRAEKHQLMREA